MELRFDNRGLVPAVAQDAKTGAVLMVAWMNQEAYDKTRATGFAHFYSRSRQKLWKKGEQSKNTLAVTEVRIDCDEDTVLLSVVPSGPACHTGKTSCFFRTADETEDDGPRGAPATIVDRLFTVLTQRKAADPNESYTSSLLAAGWPTIKAKIAEEHDELANELVDGDDKAVVHEAADLLFHVMVAFAKRDIEPQALWDELSRRFGTSGHDEKASRPR